MKLAFAATITMSAFSASAQPVSLSKVKQDSELIIPFTMIKHNGIRPTIQASVNGLPLLSNCILMPDSLCTFLIRSPI
jgi:hypothetical protein